MLLNAFTRELGTRQGRIAPVDASPTAGLFVFCLGVDRVGLAQDLLPGDFTQIEQEATFASGARLFRVRANLRHPASIVSGYKWVFQVLLDDVVMNEYRLPADGRTRRRDFAINVSKVAPGLHVVTLRLRFTTDDNVQYIGFASTECGP